MVGATSDAPAQPPTGDQAAREVLEAARQEAADLGDEAVGTEHVLLALAGADRVTASLLAQAGASAATLRALAPRRHAGRPTDNETLLAALGIDLAEIRRRAEQTFGQRCDRRCRGPRPTPTDSPTASYLDLVQHTAPQPKARQPARRPVFAPHSEGRTPVVSGDPRGPTSVRLTGPSAPCARGRQRTRV
ncbi:MAG: Clp protease N-terminal domain-containing protein [Acidimicrobiia bacterium]